MSFDARRLYELLPAIYRIRDAELGDAERGGPLKALLEAIAPQVAILEEDLAQLYDDQFIETCADWVVPYIGDLIGYRALHGVVPKISSPRAEVANTIAYRRRKGTASMLEQLTRDVTGWDARIVEFFQLLATTQYMNHLRPENLYTPDLRQWQSLEHLYSASDLVVRASTVPLQDVPVLLRRLNSAFDPVAHTLDVRRIASRQGRYNIPNIGIFLWRLISYFVPGKVTPKTTFLSTARAIAAHPGGYTFNPVGLDTPLFNPPLLETEITHLAEPRNVSEPLRRRELYEELETRRQALVDFVTPLKTYFDDSDYQVFQIVADEQLIPAEEILICNLSDWQRPLASKNYQRWQRPPNGKDYRRKPIDPSQPPQSIQSKTIKVAVDPVLGRLVFPTDPATVEVSYAYGFSTDMGGGTYDRSEYVSPFLRQTVTWQVGVTKTLSASPPKLVQTLADAINAWNNQAPGTVGIIAIMDSRTYRETLPTIQIPADSQLLIIAADWPEVDSPDIPGQKQRLPGQVTPDRVRPHVLGDLSIQGTASNTTTENLGKLLLNGLLMEGNLTIFDGNLGELQVTHCTLTPLAPEMGKLAVTASNPNLTVSLDDSICGLIALSEKVSKLEIVSSIVDAGKEEAIAAAGADTTVQTSTIFGSSTVRSLEASNSIFMGKVVAIRRQVGCVRFSSLPFDSQVSRRYRCQPDLALVQQAKELNLNSASDLPQLEQDSIQARLIPQFTSSRYRDPGYCQLSQRCAIEIRQGADDEAEMGVFHDLYQPQRETNLRVRLDEYLRFGLEAGIFYAT